MSRNWNRDEPEMDSEDYVSRKQIEVGYCECCDSIIYEGEPYYDIDGTLICEECGIDWLRQYKRN